VHDFWKFFFGFEDAVVENLFESLFHNDINQAHFGIGMNVKFCMLN